MPIALIDDQIHLYPMKTHIPSDGSDIGGSDPLTTAYKLIPSESSGLMMSMSGNKTPGQYPAWMVYPASARPILPNIGKLRLQFKQCVSAAAQAAANVRETDTLIVSNELKGQLSGQVRFSDGALMVGAGASGWAIVPGVKIPALTPNKVHTTAWNYTFNFAGAKPVASVTSYEQDGDTYPVPANLQNVAMIPTTWPTGVYLQLQQGSLPAGVEWDWMIKDAKYIWPQS